MPRKYPFLTVLHLSVGTAVKVKEYDMGVIDAVVAEFSGYRGQKAGFSASPDAGDNLDESGVGVKTTYFAKVVFALENLHVTSILEICRKVKL